MSFPRTLDHMSWFSLASCISILVAGIIGMVGAGLHPVHDRTVSVAISSSFDTAFISLTKSVIQQLENR